MVAILDSRRRWRQMTQVAGTTPVRERSCPRGLHRIGFTLIEVLVVVAIIALLVSILIPSLASAREQSRRAVCLSNLHQTGIGFSLYSADFKQYLPAREAFGYYIKKVVGPAGAKVNVPINYGALYGKYVGKDLHIFYCPGNETYGYGNPKYGAHSFFDTNVSLTFGGYIYAVPVLAEPPTHPRESVKGVYPKHAGVSATAGNPGLPGLSPVYVTWADNKQATTGYDPRGRAIQALQADDVISNNGGLGLGEFVHKTGYNVLFSDYHAKWVADPNRLIARLNGGKGPTSGNGGVGSNALFDAWEIFSRNP